MKILYQDDDIAFYEPDEGSTLKYVLENKTGDRIIVCVDGDDNDNGEDFYLKPHESYGFGSDLYGDWLAEKLNNGDFVIDDY